MYRVINAIDGTMIMDVMNKWVSIAGVRVDRQQVGSRGWSCWQQLFLTFTTKTRINGLEPVHVSLAVERWWCHLSRR